MMTHNNSGIVFDAKSGISEEEQREILAKIDSITEKNRLSLAEDGRDERKKQRFKAKKSGGRFPVIVNIIAFAVLAGGLIFLSSMQWKTDAQVRTGTKVYNNVERALIEEIRKETLSLLEAKDREISLLISKHGEIDEEEYSSTLAVLQDQRSQILEDARAKEAVLRARLAAASGPDAASGTGGELDRLNMEQIQAAAVEAQMGAFFANLNSQIADNRLDEASGTIKSMRDFINTPAFQALRSIQARKELYAQAINSFETMVEEARKYQAMLNSDNNSAAENVNPLSGLQSVIAQLEKDLAEKDKTIEAVSSQGSGATRRLNELAKENSALQTENKRLQTDLDRQTRSAASLQQNIDQTTSRFQQAQRDLQTEKAETARLTQIVTANERTIANRNDIITRIRNEVELDREYDEIPPAEIKTRITRIQSALRSIN